MIGNKIIYPLHPCPWCKLLPSLKFYFHTETWLPKIVCDSSCCSVNPESKPQVIRNTCKIDLERLQIKMKALFESWNTGNPIECRHGKEIDFDLIIEEGRKCEEERNRNSGHDKKTK